jgi:hypothetical protein
MLENLKTSQKYKSYNTSLTIYRSLLLSGFIGLSKADSNTEISVREAARLQSIGDGQCFVKCSCKTGLILIFLLLKFF